MRFRSGVGVGLLASLALALPAAPAAAADAEVMIMGFAYEPNVVRVDVGEAVTWVNHDPEPHTATAEDGSFDTGIIEPGATSEPIVMEQEGAFPYFCQLHPEMQGQVVVGDAEPIEPVFQPGLVENLDADDPVTAAIAWSRRTFEDGEAPVALLARSDLFPDSLASAPVQGALGAPLLLTPPNETDPRVAAELDRLGVGEVVIFGGEATGVRDYGRTARRVAGTTRIETAIEAAKTGYPEAESALLVRAGVPAGEEESRAFADSLAAGAAGAFMRMPVLLSQSDRLSDSTRQYLQGAGIRHVVVAGGEGALSAQVVADLEALGIEVTRIAGPNRFVTAAKLTAFAIFSGAQAPKGILYTEGQSPIAWAGGFTTGAIAARGGLVLLTNGPGLPAPSTFGAMLPGLGLICGPLVDDAACQKVDAAFGAGPFFRPPDLAAYAEADNEVPPSDAAGSAFVGLLRSPDPSALCYTANVYIMGSAAHIHAGAAGTNGDIVVPLDFTGELEPGLAVGCTFDLAPELTEAIFADPAAYYVNIHTAEHPNGAVRDQLTEIVAEVGTSLSGEAEVGGGAPEAGGFASVTRPAGGGEVCVNMAVFGLEEAPSAAHIHQGAEGENGDVVLTLPTPHVVVPGVAAAAGCVEASDELAEAIFADPAAYYVNVHTPGFPDGAVRGQLQGAPPGEPAGKRLR